MIKVGDYISKDRIFIFEDEDKNTILDTLSRSVAQSDSINDGKKFHDDIMERESIMSTGLGLGIAIPHAKSRYADDIVIAIGVSKQGVEWGALDGKPVHYIVMIAANTEQHNLYLKILAKVALVLKSEKKRNVLMEAGKSNDIFEVFKGV